MRIVAAFAAIALASTQSFAACRLSTDECLQVEKERAMASFAGQSARYHAVGLTPYQALERGLKVEGDTLVARQKIVGRKIINEAFRLRMCDAARDVGRDPPRECP